MKTVEEFIYNYCEEYSSGDLNKDNPMECLYYLRGFMDSFFADKVLGEDYKRMDRCVEVFRGAARLIEQLHRESRVEKP